MKRILLLEHPQFTSCTYFLWHGLREIEERFPERLMVTVYPFIPTHYDVPSFQVESLPWWRWLNGMLPGWKANPSTLPYGIPPFQPDENLLSQNTQKIIRPELCPRLFHQRNLMESEEQVLKLLDGNHFDLVILGNSHRVPTILLSRLKSQAKRMPPIIYLDAGERDELNEHWVHVFRPDLIFKQIVTPEVKARGLVHPIPGYNFKIYPLPLCSPIVEQNLEYFNIAIQWLRTFSNIKMNPKVFPVFYHLGETWPERAHVMRALNEWVHQGEHSISVARGGSTAPYHLLLAMSKSAVSMRGSGRDTTRYWEIPLYQTALISDGTMGCIHPYPFEDRKTAFFYRSIPELIEIVKQNQKDDRELIRIAQAGQQHLEKYHSTFARSVFFLDICDQELGFLEPQFREDLRAWKRGKGWEDRPWQGPVV